MRAILQQGRLGMVQQVVLRLLLLQFVIGLVALLSSIGFADHRASFAVVLAWICSALPVLLFWRISFWGQKFEVRIRVWVFVLAQFAKVAAAVLLLLLAFAGFAQSVSVPWLLLVFISTQLLYGLLPFLDKLFRKINL
jgi:F0F1-type ATP synthase assembly protein I